jgi:amino acid transporter
MAKKESTYGEGKENAEVEQSATRNSEYNLATEHDQLQRGLKSGHIQFLALGMN